MLKYKLGGYFALKKKKKKKALFFFNFKLGELKYVWYEIEQICQ